ncbi:MAG: hypothetical protein GY927_11455 [bacterium]|nr:hypothetical protein [bacterium]
MPFGITQKRVVLNNNEERRQDMSGIGERLARIETGQTNIKADQNSIKADLTRVVNLLERIVRVEERLGNFNSRLLIQETIVAEHAKEIAAWRSTRRIGVWIAGIVGAIIAAVGIKHWG